MLDYVMLGLQMLNDDDDDDDDMDYIQHTRCHEMLSNIYYFRYIPFTEPMFTEPIL